MQNIKLVVVGDDGVGKTNLLLTYTQNRYTGNTGYTPLVMDNYGGTNVMFGSTPVSLSMWDTTGCEDYDRLRPLSYPYTDVFLVCYSVASRTSFEHVASRFAPEITHHCGDAPRILVALKADIPEDDRTVTYKDGQELADAIGAAAFVEVSSLLHLGTDSETDSDLRTTVPAVFQLAIKTALENCSSTSGTPRSKHKCLIM
ncbi:Rac1 GTP binding protein [Thecamonas trahens ATCC 50062]|uniref:Rac1 GTP binding protein n=1 Tax=Thecamonas trahens ATCC 50062 TaxID=461836 RepID=A0A0L0DVB6_THETB|nr:Rac1 GTP binding protein [Thecamonas trahens ATCC 50062]KNC55483.1 Rac1 GTP binding protein [Thecamonas trahens ATCC 50062]|eukprot:XP_013761263.1 Rac1 GTP binding protein [Thecamonas trahens ATCC 50062]